ncbi:hypothetical protein EG856_03530 [Mycoplasmopsis phocirhinis]|uniref:Uncharacterized protein n=1 Tax=Mycoplasmopsis phocirhinis TaxID=142650 RepID=A0A4P6MSA6_9BACT|nr:hypothetical protein [Mycoplasmopsis phocirhinis]QBF34959.1 hypothetical protein EG856_03530 [Mycoplasmopsis phocirhinis]
MRKFKQILLISIFLMIVLIIPFIEQMIINFYTKNDSSESNFVLYHFSGISSVTTNFFRNTSQTIEFYKTIANSSIQYPFKLAFLFGVFHGFGLVALILIWVFLAVIYSVINLFKRRIAIPILMIILAIISLFYMLLTATKWLNFDIAQYSKNQFASYFLNSQFITMFIFSTISFLLSIVEVVKSKKLR